MRWGNQKRDRLLNSAAIEAQTPNADMPGSAAPPQLEGNLVVCPFFVSFHTLALRRTVADNVSGKGPALTSRRRSFRKRLFRLIVALVLLGTAGGYWAWLESPGHKVRVLMDRL